MDMTSSPSSGLSASEMLALRLEEMECNPKSRPGSQSNKSFDPDDNNNVVNTQEGDNCTTNKVRSLTIN